MSSKKEYQINDTVQMGLVTLVCTDDSIENEGCEQCALSDMWNSADIYCSRYVGDCCKHSRTDNKDVIFKLKEEEI